MRDQQIDGAANESEQTTKALSTLRIIYIALIIGPLLMTGIFVMLRMGQANPPNAAAPNAPDQGAAAGGAENLMQGYLLTKVAFLFAFMALVSALILPALLFDRPRAREESEVRPYARSKSPGSGTEDPKPNLVALYQVRSIVTGAILESAIYMCGIAYFIEGLPASLAAVGGLIAVLIALMPTVGRFEAWREKVMAA
jgi:hypothetical protein